MTIINLQLKNVMKNKKSPGLVETEKGMLLTEQSSHKTYHDKDLKILSKS